MERADGPRTIVRPPPGSGGPFRSDLFAELAGPLLALSVEVARDPRPNPGAVATEARRAAEAFEATALQRGVPRDAIAEARDALLAVLEARVLGNPALAPTAWERERRKLWPGVPAIGVLELELARRRAAAEAAGPTRRDLARFLRHCEEAVAAAPRARQSPGVRWGLFVPLAVALGLAAWAGFAEWRFSAGLLATLPTQQQVIAAADGAPAAARELDALQKAVEDVAIRSRDSPLGLAAHLGRFSPAAIAGRRYSAAVDALLPGPLEAGLATALATEGGSLALYDALRTLAILQGDVPWQPAFVAGWVEARAADDPTLLPFAAHAAALSGPPAAFAAQDPELLGQARSIAADGDPATFAFLELARDPRASALPGWSPALVPNLDAVLVRRSGRPLSAAIPGLDTAAGWAFATGGGARDAIERAAALRGRVLGGTAAAPVSEAAVLDVLQARTLDTWSDQLADLRVRPFTDQPSSLLVSGTLGRRDSPLVALYRAVWHEVGGDDAGRSYAQQLRIASTFGTTHAYVERGGMEEIRQIFAGLNAALAALDSDAATSRRRLMDVQYRAASVATLNQAPRLVVQTIEDVLAQTSASREDNSQPRAALLWRRDLAAACRAALSDRFPFSAGGADADLAAVAAFLGPGGALAGFYSGELAPILDTSASPWTWKPEARLAGLTPESAAFFEHAIAVGDALFPAAGVQLTLAALAQRGSASVTLGGVSAPIQPTGEPSALAWPGPAPDDGFAITFPGAGEDARQAWTGPWGLLRFLDALHLRARDDGRRFLIDVRLPSTRAYLELAFASAANPATAREVMSHLTCPTL